MRSKSLILLAPLFLSLFSCANYKKDTEDLLIINKCENVSHLFYLPTVEQLNRVTMYEDALVFVSLKGCSHCHDEREKLEKFIFDTSSIIYEVERSVYLEAYDDTTNQIGTYAEHYPKVSKYPTYLYYKNGDIINRAIGSLGSDYSSFKENLENSIYQNNCYMLNDYTTEIFNDTTYHFFETNESVDETLSLELQGFSTTRLDKKIEEDENKMIFFTWRRCNDCKKFKEIVNNYLYKKEKKIYYYEVDGYYLLKRNSNETLSKLGLEMWSSFSSKYHLITDDFYNIDKYNNKAGYVPTLTYYKASSFNSMNVFLNESNIIKNDDDTLSYSKAFNKDALKLKSKTKVSDINDSETYLKAKQELEEEAIKLDSKVSEKFLNEKDY